VGLRDPSREGRSGRAAGSTDRVAAPLATHRGDVLYGCLSVPVGLDGDLAHDAYDLCPVDGATPREIRGEIVWGRGTVGECHCDTTLREQP
jgi:hypothetical protein